MARARRTDRPIILVVDDDHDARWIYAMYLRSRGCRVFTASDGKSAVEKATALSPDLIVLDLAMPHVDGWEAMRRLERSRWTREIPIIAISAVPAARDTALAEGCDAYLAKPCEPDILWKQVQAILHIPRKADAQEKVAVRRSATS